MVADFKTGEGDDETICLCVYFAGFKMEQLTVRVKPEMSLKRFVNVLIDKFNLEQVDSCGFVGYHVLSIGNRPGGVLSYYDEDGRELTLSDKRIEDHSDLCLFYAPGTSAFYKISDSSSENVTDTGMVGIIKKFLSKK